MADTFETVCINTKRNEFWRLVLHFNYLIRILLFEGRMAFKLFKNGDELYEESKELIKRGDFAKARSTLVKSIDKDGGVDDVAAVQVALIDLRDRLTSVSAYQNLLNTLNKLESAKEVDFGLDVLDVEELKTECSLTIRKINILSAGGTGQALVDKGKELQKLAQDYQANIGNRSLLIISLFKKDTSVTGETEFYNLMAVAYETMADGVVYDNPAQAAEYQQIAAGYRQQNGQSTEENMRKVRAYAATCTCWICGRIATGEGIHFYSAPADVSPSLEDRSTTAGKTRADAKHIYICRACYTAISNRSDEISKAYYDQAMQQMAAMEARLQAQIAALQSQISFARMRD